MDKTQPHPLFKLATELGPLLVFFIANAKANLFVATGAFMVAIVAAMIASYVVTRHIPIMAVVTGWPATLVSNRAASAMVKAAGFRAGLGWFCSMGGSSRWEIMPPSCRVLVSARLSCR